MEVDAQRWDALIGVVVGGVIGGRFPLVQSIWRVHGDKRTARRDRIRSLGDEFLATLSNYLVVTQDVGSFETEHEVSADYRHEAMRTIRRQGNEHFSRLHVLIAQAEVLDAGPLRDGMNAALRMCVLEKTRGAEDNNPLRVDPWVSPEAARAVVEGVAASL